LNHAIRRGHLGEFDEWMVIMMLDGGGIAEGVKEVGRSVD